MSSQLPRRGKFLNRYACLIVAGLCEAGWFVFRGSFYESYHGDGDPASQRPATTKTMRQGVPPRFAPFTVRSRRHGFA